MVSPSLTDTVVKLDRGRADVEVDQLYKQNEIVIAQQGGETQLLKGGLYEFNATANTMRVFNGKAAVFEGQQQPMGTEGGALTGKPVDVKAGHELTLTGEPTKAASFNKNQSKDELYNWSSLRSQYLGEANINLAYGYGGAEGFAPGWFWDAGLYGYTWLPGGGPFFSPFGWGFYSPAYLYGGGLIYGRGGYGYRGGYYRGAARSGVSRGEVHAQAFSGGGFHGGGGGFHGGGGHR